MNPWTAPTPGFAFTITCATPCPNLWARRAPSPNRRTQATRNYVKRLGMAERTTSTRSSIFGAAGLMTLSVWPLHAETIDILDDHGGTTSAYAARWAQHRRDGIHVRIAGPCESECTMIVGSLRRERICVRPDARFGFRVADLPSHTARVWKSWPTDIKIWLSRHGGLTRQLTWLEAPDIYRFFRRCADEPRYSSFSVVK